MAVTVCNARQIRWKLRNPWVRFISYAKRRCACLDPEKWFPNYGAKGIKVHLTGRQLKEVWERDQAWTLKKPSLDRINSNYDYANWNVRFIEFKMNVRMAWDPMARAEFT